MPFDCTLTASEITGSETYLHLRRGEDAWVGLVKGVPDLATGGALRVWIDPAHVYLFDAEGRLVAPASYAMAV